MTERHEITVLGVVIGSYDGWDHLDPCVFAIYDFEPTPQFHGRLPRAVDLMIDYNKGEIVAQDKEGNELQRFSMLELLR